MADQNEKKIETTPTPESDTENALKDIPILSADVMPSLPKDAIINVYYVETSINALGLMGEVVEGYHAGISFELRDAKKAREWGVPAQFTIEWYATNFPFGAFLPNVVNVTAEDPVGIEWDNESRAYYIPGYLPKRWDKGRTLVGNLDGEAYAKYVDWIIEYHSKRPGYDAFEVWDRAEFTPGVTIQWFASTTCSTFAQESLVEMRRLGGKSETPKQILRRSYVPLVSRKKPTIVDLSDPDQVKELRNFYTELNNAARGAEGQALTTTKFIRLLADKLETFFVYNTATNVYQRVKLSPPYFSLANCYHPMSLPWQMIDIEGNGKLADIGAFAQGEVSFAEEMASAAKGIGGLLRRRVPELVSEKVELKYTYVASAVAVLGVALCFNKSFIVGMFFGATLGHLGPRLLLKS